MAQSTPAMGVSEEAQRTGIVRPQMKIFYAQKKGKALENQRPEQGERDRPFAKRGRGVGGVKILEALREDTLEGPLREEAQRTGIVRPQMKIFYAQKKGKALENQRPEQGERDRPFAKRGRGVGGVKILEALREDTLEGPLREEAQRTGIVRPQMKIFYAQKKGKALENQRPEQGERDRPFAKRGRGVGGVKILEALREDTLEGPLREEAQRTGIVRPQMKIFYAQKKGKALENQRPEQGERDRPFAKRGRGVGGVKILEALREDTLEGPLREEAQRTGIVRPQMKIFYAQKKGKALENQRPEQGERDRPFAKRGRGVGGVKILEALREDTLEGPLREEAQRTGIVRPQMKIFYAQKKGKALENQRPEQGERDRPFAKRGRGVGGVKILEALREDTLEGPLREEAQRTGIVRPQMKIFYAQKKGKALENQRPEQGERDRPFAKRGRGVGGVKILEALREDTLEGPLREEAQRTGIVRPQMKIFYAQKKGKALENQRPEQGERDRPFAKRGRGVGGVKILEALREDTLEGPLREEAQRTGIVRPQMKIFYAQKKGKALENQRPEQGERDRPFAKRGRGVGGVKILEALREDTLEGPLREEAQRTGIVRPQMKIFYAQKKGKALENQRPEQGERDRPFAKRGRGVGGVKILEALREDTLEGPLRGLWLFVPSFFVLKGSSSFL
ncbi:uncharacterized protein LOC113782545 [Coffea eugenioides]|uniref:uncharacterized protein LOC113782545 n=1 Tax=Coffea eugenioides TaxID=49369 RepID=UPI000F605254|nr:uncharacterized protein LOC113782545 [Coffea eugenioides]